jgi:hypothetical protein
VARRILYLNTVHQNAGYSNERPTFRSFKSEAEESATPNPCHIEDFPTPPKKDERSSVLRVPALAGTPWYHQW